MRRLLDKMAEKMLRTARFNSPGVHGRRKPRLVLTGPFASAIGDAKPGTKVSLRIHGVVTGRGNPGQKDEATIEVDEVSR